MMKMMFALNKNGFDGLREVTCYSCHRGARDPIATPILENETLPHPPAADTEAEKLAASLPTASELIENYVKALGGAAALEKINTRVQKGVESFGGESVRVEIFTEAPDRQSLVRHLPQGDSATVFDGHAAWFAMPGRPARVLHGADLEAVRTDADLHFPLHIRELYPEVHVQYPEKIGQRDVYVLFCIRETQPPTKLYFDEQSGLLVRVVRYAESPLGLNPQQMDYADYRDVDGVQVPFRVTISQSGSTSTIRIGEVKHNVPIDHNRFSRPTPD
jgi:photosynthetic reaction center cytochrome c subunit